MSATTLNGVLNSITTNGSWALNGLKEFTITWGGYGIEQLTAGANWAHAGINGPVLAQVQNLWATTAPGLGLGQVGPAIAITGTLVAAFAANRLLNSNSKIANVAGIALGLAATGASIAVAGVAFGTVGSGAYAVGGVVAIGTFLMVNKAPVRNVS